MSKRKDRDRAKHTLFRNDVAVSTARLQRTALEEQAARAGLVLPEPTLIIAQKRHSPAPSLGKIFELGGKQ